jgi:hypothetical protein
LEEENRGSHGQEMGFKATRKRSVFIRTSAVSAMHQEM